MAGPSEYNEATLPSECIVDVGESLPELAEELFKAQATHGDQLYEREDTLKILQVSKYLVAKRCIMMLFFRRLSQMVMNFKYKVLS